MSIEVPLEKVGRMGHAIHCEWNVGTNWQWIPASILAVFIIAAFVFRRRKLAFFSITCLIASLSLAIVWGVSYWGSGGAVVYVRDFPAESRCEFVFGRGGFGLTVTRAQAVFGATNSKPGNPSYLGFEFDGSRVEYPSRLGSQNAKIQMDQWGFRSTSYAIQRRGGFRYEYSATSPGWVVVVFSGALPALWLCRILRRRKRIRLGFPVLKATTAPTEIASPKEL